jgi:DNA repair photolyase
MGFAWSVNPYRGCTHACAYCYARAYHEYLGLGAGTDFETRLFVKRRAPELLRAAFLRPSWRGERVAFSGATDCYQPIERRLELTRRCLEVCREFRSPVSLITRSALVLRDLDLLRGLARDASLRLSISLPVLDRRVAQALEPGAPLPATRLAAVRALSEAGVAVGLSLAPVIPGLTDHALPGILAAGREAGAVHAHMGLVRLQGRVGEVFGSRLRARLGDRVADKVLGRLRRLRGGSLDGPVNDDAGWRTTKALFRLHHDRLGYRPLPPEPASSPFRRPGSGRQLGLFQ